MVFTSDNTQQQPNYLYPLNLLHQYCPTLYTDRQKIKAEECLQKDLSKKREKAKERLGVFLKKGFKRRQKILFSHLMIKILERRGEKTYESKTFSSNVPECR